MTEADRFRMNTVCSFFTYLNASSVSPFVEFANFSEVRFPVGLFQYILLAAPLDNFAEMR